MLSSLGEVVEDEEVDGDELGHDGFLKVVETTLPQRAGHRVCSDEADAAAMRSGPAT